MTRRRKRLFEYRARAHLTFMESLPADVLTRVAPTPYLVRNKRMVSVLVDAIRVRLNLARVSSVREAEKALSSNCFGNAHRRELGDIRLAARTMTHELVDSLRRIDSALPARTVEG